MATESDFVARLAEYAVPLQTDPDADFAELAPLADALDGATVVGLGEATHGTREFFRSKHLLVRHLVAEQGFRLVGLEASFAETRPVNDYVVSGEGDPADALGQTGFWTWDTEEVLALVEWLRAFNDGRPDADKVRFYGFDATYARSAATAIADYLERTDPDCFEAVEPALDRLTDGRPRDDPEALSAWMEAADTVVTELEGRFAEPAARVEGRERPGDGPLSDRERQLLEHHRRTIAQCLELTAAKAQEGTPPPNAVRDRFMAENVSRILAVERTDRIVLWGHNGHVKTGRFRVGDWEDPPKTMGQHLRVEFGSEYYALGFEFGRGSFRAIPRSALPDDPCPEAVSVDSIPPDSVAACLSDLDEPCLFLDVDDAGVDGPVADWFDREQRLHNVGSVYFEDPERDYAPVVLADEFDGLVFVAETTPTRPL